MSARPRSGGSVPRLAVGVLVGAAAVILALIAFSGGSDQTHVRMVMPNALGLRKGSGVRLGGILVGKVSNLSLTKSDRVRIDLDISDKAVHLGRGASVTVKSLNLLGEKYAALDPGSASSGGQADVTIPASRVTTATDLDQVLDVLDTDTRTRLAILINEAGLAMTGRRADFSALLTKLPPALNTATGLLHDVVSDNRTLASLITHSDRFLGTTVHQSADLQAFINAAAKAAGVFAERDDALRSTLAKAPAGLAALRGFLDELQTTTVPLGAAARDLTATAPVLDDTLRQVGPFRAAAQPTLRQATAVAPALTDLGQKATPTVRGAVGPLRALHTFAARAVPLTRQLGISTPDLLGVLEGWGRAIQGRDGRGHVFHGGVTFGAGMLQTLLQAPGDGQSRKKVPAAHKKADGPAPAAPSASPPAAGAGLLPKVTAAPQKLLKDLPPAVQHILSGLTGGILKPAGGQAPAPAPEGSAQDRARNLLDYLLGS